MALFPAEARIIAKAEPEFCYFGRSGGRATTRIRSRSTATRPRTSPRSHASHSSREAAWSTRTSALEALAPRDQLRDADFERVHERDLLLRGSNLPKIGDDIRTFDAQLVNPHHRIEHFHGRPRSDRFGVGDDSRGFFAHVTGYPQVGC